MRLHTRPQQILRCAFCHDASGALRACTGCGTLLHRDCAGQLTGCVTLGCARPGLGERVRPGRSPVELLWIAGTVLSVATALGVGLVGLGTVEWRAAAAILGMTAGFVVWALS